MLRETNRTSSIAGFHIGSISASLSCPVYVPPRKETGEELSGEERGLLSRKAAGKRA